MSLVLGKCLAKFIVAVSWLFFGVEVLFLVLLWGIAAGYIGVSSTILESLKSFLTSDEFLYLNEDLEKSDSLLVSFGLVIAGYFLCQMLMNILLTVGVDKSDILKLGLWLVLSWISFIIRTFYFIHTMIKQAETGQDIESDFIKRITCFALSVIPLIVIHIYTDALVQAKSRDISRGSKFDKDAIMNV